jgi:hypothetical protein
MADNDNFLDNIEGSEDTEESTTQETDIEPREVSSKQVLEQAQRNVLARKRIDDLLEKKRLKELLDDSDDW